MVPLQEKFHSGILKGVRKQRYEISLGKGKTGYCSPPDVHGHVAPTRAAEAEHRELSAAGLFVGFRFRARAVMCNVKVGVGVYSTAQLARVP